ncbi:MAG: hypothetical protein K1X53_07210 [Candidatus Sumerlaeaceae bacterium]|nr:hypothetical protein [Candidatus Sumerlaeaceae bacterium]
MKNGHMLHLPMIGPFCSKVSRGVLILIGTTTLGILLGCDSQTATPKKPENQSPVVTETSGGQPRGGSSTTKQFDWTTASLEQVRQENVAASQRNAKEARDRFHEQHRVR